MEIPGKTASAQMLKVILAVICYADKCTVCGTWWEWHFTSLEFSSYNLLHESNHEANPTNPNWRTLQNTWLVLLQLLTWCKARTKKSHLLEENFSHMELGFCMCRDSFYWLCNFSISLELLWKQKLSATYIDIVHTKLYTGFFIIKK